MFVVISILLLILDSLIAIISNVRFVVLIRYSRSSKWLLRKHVFKRNKKREIERERERVYFSFNFLYVINIIIFTIVHVFWIFID